MRTALVLGTLLFQACAATPPPSPNCCAIDTPTWAANGTGVFNEGGPVLHGVGIVEKNEDPATASAVAHERAAAELRKLLDAFDAALAAKVPTKGPLRACAPKTEPEREHTENGRTFALSSVKAITLANAYVDESCSAFGADKRPDALDALELLLKEPDAWAPRSAK